MEQVSESLDKDLGETCASQFDRISSSGMFETYLVNMVDMDGKEFPVRLLPDCGAGSCILAKEALPPGGRWCKTPCKKIRINGVGKSTCSATEEVTFDITPNYDVRKFQVKQPFMTIKALLLDGKFKRELPKYELPQAMIDVLQEYNVSDKFILNPGTDPLPFDILVGMNVLNGMDRKNHVRFSKNLILKRSPFGDALCGPIDEFIEHDKTCKCTAQRYRSPRKRSKRCICVESETVHVTVPMVCLTAAEAAERDQNTIPINSCSTMPMYAALPELNEIERAIEAIYKVSLGQVFRDNKTPSIFVENSDAYNDYMLSESLRKYCNLLEKEMEGSEITPDEHNTTVHEKFKEGLVRVDDPTPEIPDRKRYEIQLPWIPDQVPLMSKNRGIAMQRLYWLLQKFKTNPKMEEIYGKQIQDWYDAGFIEEVPMTTLDELDEANEPYCVLPHHVVLKPESKTTPYRVVLDGAAHEQGKGSLNDTLETGPNLLPNLKRITMRFRFGKTYYMSDISRAFFQLQLCKIDARRLYMYWRTKNADGTPNTILYRFKRMPWGMNCSPFCLIATINHHLDTFTKDASTIFPNSKHLESDPIFAEYLKDETYMDDLIQAEDNTEKLIQLAEFAQRALSLGCFDLVKIESNDPILHRMYNPDIAADAQYELSIHKVLGTLYNPILDTLTVCTKKLQGLKSDLIYNRRVALRIQGMFFDPLGLAGPIHLNVRKLVQDSSLKTKHWDTPFTAEYQTKWQAMTKSLQEFSDFQVKRLVAPIRGDYKINVFCDASKVGYGAVAYITSNGESTLLSSIVRIIPENMSTVSVPRLELLSAVVASQLWTEIKDALRCPPTKVTFWTDSMTSLAWIRGDASAYKAFVSNRIRKIQTRTDGEGIWQFCPGTENPADILSRGCEPKLLPSNKMWLHGPVWLHDEANWPKIAHEEVDQKLTEIETQLNSEKRTATAFLARTTLSLSPFDILFGTMLFSDHKMPHLIKTLIQLCHVRPNFSRGKKWPTDPEILQIVDTANKAGRKDSPKSFRPETRPDPSKSYRTEKHRAEAEDFTNKTWIENGQKGQPRFSSLIREKFFKMKGISKQPRLYESEEWDAAKYCIYRITQRHYAPDLYNALEAEDHSLLGDKDKQLVNHLGLKIDRSNGVIYTHGRILTDSESSKSLFKKLIWIPSQGRIALAIMNRNHEKAGHMGFSATLALTREKFWIMSPTRVFNQLRKFCRCCHANQKLMYGDPDDGSLPQSRRTITRPFEIIGVDFAGPLFRAAFQKPFYEPPSKKAKTAVEKLLQMQTVPEPEPPETITLPDPLLDPNAQKLPDEDYWVINPVTGRRKKVKVPIDTDPAAQKDSTGAQLRTMDLSYYVMIFTCANTRLVHLALMKDIKTQTMAMVWDEFCSEYGTPSKVYSDNGSNLKHFEKTCRKISMEVCKRDTPWVQWRFIPAASPWWGGFYERMVGMMKNILHKTCERMRVPSELHAHHLVKQAQNCMNNRPLWGLSQDPGSVRIIKPNSFKNVTVENSTVETSDPIGVSTELLLKELYEAQHKRIAEIWQEFHLGYMSALRAHARKTKLKFTINDLKIGDLVLYESPGTVRNFWPIARITGFVPPRDGKSKAVRLSKYVPNEVDQKLKEKLYPGKNRLTNEMRRYVMGHFKQMPNTYSIRRLAPYEFWGQVIRPCDIVGNDVDRLPAQILEPTVFPKKKHRPPTVLVGDVPVPQVRVEAVAQQHSKRKYKVKTDVSIPSTDLPFPSVDPIPRIDITVPVPSTSTTTDTKVDTTSVPLTQYRIAPKRQFKSTSSTPPVTTTTKDFSPKSRVRLVAKRQQVRSADLPMDTSTSPASTDTNIADRIRSNPRRRKIFRPFESVMYLQDDVSGENSQHQECRGGMAHITLESSVRDTDKKVLEIPINKIDDLKSNARGDYESESSRALNSAFAFCASSSYRMTSFRFVPTLSVDQILSVNISALSLK
jgi:hypothetical protein